MKNSVFTADRWTLQFHADPGHGWLIVSKHDLAKFGMHEGFFTSFSYNLGDAVALEEDCDATRFINRAIIHAWETKTHIPDRVIAEEHVSFSSPVRRAATFGTWRFDPVAFREEREMARDIIAAI